MKDSLRLRQISLLLFVLWGAASLSGVEVEPDLRRIEPFVLVTGAPAAAPLATGAAAPEGTPPFFHVFFHLAAGDPSFPGKIRELRGDAARVHDRLYTGSIPGDATLYISHWPEVAYIEGSKLARPMLDVSRPEVSADTVHAGTGLPTGYTGAGMYMGIVDTGLSSGHPDFSVNGDPSSPRVVHWYPSPASAGTDTEWHGTHVAGIAAGNGFLSGGEYTGMAPDADLLVAKTSFTTFDIQNAVSNLLTFAGTTPVAINLSLGQRTGPHDGTSGFEAAIGSYAANGVFPNGKQIISVAAGNERLDNEHFLATLPPFGSVTVTLSLEAGTPFIDIWADGDDRYTVTATLGSESATAASGRTATSASRNVTIHNRTDTPPNGATHISVFFTTPAASSASIRLARTRNGGRGRVDAYMDEIQGTFTTGTQAGTVTEPANAEAVLAVGSYNTKVGGVSGTIGSISTFSSLGPTRDGRVKPDLTSPGSVIYSTKSGDPYLGPHPQPTTVPGNDNYISLQGTSMSTAHVTGIALLAWESNPLLTPAQMRERLKRTSDLQTAAPDTVWGYGKVNALAAVTETVAGISGPVNALPGQALTLRADEKSSGPFGNTLTYNWGAAGATVSPSTGSSTAFTASAPGDYTVTLTATPGSLPYSRASATIHVNTIPVALIDGPASDNVGLPVTFTGTGSSSRDVGQALTYRWVLVSRPTGSTASLPANNVPTVTFTPDVGGTYEVGLRVNDTMDDSVLATRVFTALGGSVSVSGGGGGGGCVIGIRNSEGNGASSLTNLLLILFPLLILPARKSGYRLRHSRRPDAPERALGDAFRK